MGASKVRADASGDFPKHPSCRHKCRAFPFPPPQVSCFPLAQLCSPSQTQ